MPQYNPTDTPGQALNTIYAEDIAQHTDTWSGSVDAGLMKMLPPVSATPPTPTVTLQAGSLSGSYQWGIYWITGVQDGTGSVHVTGRTMAGLLSAAQTLSSQEGVVAIPSGTTVPSGVKGWGVVRCKAGGGQMYMVPNSEQFMNTSGAMTSSFTDNTADNSLTSVAPTQNSTGTAIAGINALAHGPSLTALLHFNGSLDTSRGVRGTFTRSSSANNPDTLASEGNNVPSYVTGKWGDAGGALSIWEGTTNLVYNSDFETVTGTATVFSDALTAGTTADPAWTVQSGSFTWSTSGATSGASDSQVTAGNSAWKPLTGSGGQNLALTVQATFTTGTAVTGNNVVLNLWQDASNWYRIIQQGTSLYLQKAVSGTITTFGTVAQSVTASTTYTATLAIDHTGALTAKLYSGTGTGGTLLQTLTATDTSLTGGFLVGVGGDTGVVISNVSVTAPWADGWTIGGDSRVAWALTSSGAINGGHSVSGYLPPSATGISGNVYSNSAISISASTKYTASGYMNTSSVGSGGANVQLVYYNNGTVTSAPKSLSVTGTVTTNRYTVSATSDSTANQARIELNIQDSGTVTFDAIQLEAKAYSSPYLRSDSTSSTATRSAETYTLPASLMNASQGTIAGWISFGTLGNAGNGQCFLSLDGTNRWDFWLFGSVIQHYDGKLSAWTNTGFAPSVDTPLHFAATWDGTNTYIYINGVKMATTANSINLSGASHIYVGSLNTSGYQADGSTDDLHIFSTALTDAQIASLYNATQPTIDDLATPIAPDTTVYNQSSSSPDANDVYTTVTYTRRDGTTYMVSALSGTPPSGTSQYPTMTWTYYAADGVTQTRQQTFSLTYDASGKRTGVSMTN